MRPCSTDHSGVHHRAMSVALVSTVGLELEPIRSRGVTEEDLARWFLVLCTEGGNARAASRVLASQGVRVSARRLASLRERHPARYREVRDRHFRRLEDVLVAEQRELAMAAGQAAREAVELERARIASGDVKDAAASARNSETVAGIAVDKLLGLSGRPTSVEVHVSLEEILRARRREYAQYIEGSVEEVGELEGAA